MLNIENYIPVVKSHGLNTQKDVYFGGAFNLGGSKMGTRIDLQSSAASGSTPLTTPLARIKATNNTYDQWLLDLENYGVMTTLEIQDYTQKNYHENGIGCSSIAAQDKSIIQQGYVNFRLQHPDSTADCVEINSFSTGDALLIEQNNDGIAVHTLKDFYNKNQSKNNAFFDDYTRVDDGNTYTKSGANVFIRNRVQLTSGSITDTSVVLDARQENALSTGNAVHFRNAGTGKVLELLGTGSGANGNTLFVNTDGNSPSIAIDSEATTRVPFYIDSQNTSDSTFYILDQGVHGTGTFGAMVRLQMNNSSSSAPVISIDNNGTGRDIFIDHDDTGANPSIEIDRDGNNAAKLFGLTMAVDNAGGGGVGGIDLSSFSTGEAVVKVVADAVDPTGGGGVAAGRIAIDVGGVIKYIAYYD